MNGRVARSLGRAMICTVLLVPLTAWASGGHSDMDKGHGSMKEMGHEKKMDHSEQMGDDIRDATVDGYKLAYHLIDMKEKMESMKDMKGMSMKEHDMAKMGSHHLMVFIMEPGGEMVKDAKVGYLITGPGGEQKAMAMGMKGGFGADVDFKAKGTYTIKTKAVAGDKKLVDEFQYTVD